MLLEVTFSLDVVVSTGGIGSPGGSLVVQLHVALVQGIAVHLDSLEAVARGVSQLLPVTQHDVSSSSAQHEQHQVGENVGRQVAQVYNHCKDLIHVKDRRPHEPEDEELLISLLG